MVDVINAAEGTEDALGGVEAGAAGWRNPRAASMSSVDWRKAPGSQPGGGAVVAGAGATLMGGGAEVTAEAMAMAAAVGVKVAGAA